MPRYQITTLVDITKTDPARSETDKKKLSQQANFNSLIQALGLRANLQWVNKPVKKTGRLPSPLDGAAAHWIWIFDVEREDVYLKGSDSVGLARDDLNGVPVIGNLENTIDLEPCCFLTRGDNANIWIEEIR